MTSRSSKSAGLGFLSALTVARRNSTRGDAWLSLSRDESEPASMDVDKADLTRLKCAFDGGLKLESRTNSALTGDDEGGFDGGMLRRTRNVEDDAAKSRRA